MAVTYLKDIKDKKLSTPLRRQQSFFAASVILIVSVFITKVLGMVYRIPIAHILGGSGMAYFSSAYSIFMPVYAVAVSGVPPAVARLTAQQCALGNYRNARRLRSAANMFFFLTGLAASALLVIFAKPVCDIVIAEPQSRYAVAAIAPCIAIGAVAAVERGYAEGMRNMIPTAVSEIMEAVIKLAAGLGFAVMASHKAELDFADSGIVFGTYCESAQQAQSVALPVIAAASVLGVTLSNLCGAVYLWLSRKLSGDGISDELLELSQEHTEKRELLKSLLELTVPFALASVITTLSGVIDLVTITRCLDRAFEADISYSLRKFAPMIAQLAQGEKLSSFIYGSYSGLALTIFGIVPALTAMFGRSILPSVSAAYATRNRQALAGSVSDALTMALFVCLPCGLGMCVFSQEILSFLFAGRDGEIAVCVSVLSVLGIACIPVSLCAPAFIIFQAAGLYKEPIRITLIGCIVKLAANIMLVSRPELGITGAGIATLICYAVMMAICLRRLRRMCGEGALKLRSVVCIAIAAVLSIEGAFLLYRLLISFVQMRIALTAAILFSVNIYILATELLSVLPKSPSKNKNHSQSY